MREFAGVLCDLDGTLVDSIAAVERAWTKWCATSGMDPVVVVPQIHGRRAIDSLRRVAPHMNAEAQLLVLDSIEATDVEGIRAVHGSVEFLTGLPVPWAIVTSGNTAVARARMAAGGIPTPNALVCGEDVPNGKPAPDAFLIAAERLGLEASDCVAFEDNEPGVASAASAGAFVVGLSAVPIVGAHAILADFRDLGWELSASPGPVRIRLNLPPDPRL